MFIDRLGDMYTDLQYTSLTQGYSYQLNIVEERKKNELEGTTRTVEGSRDKKREDEKWEKDEQREKRNGEWEDEVQVVVVSDWMNKRFLFSFFAVSFSYFLLRTHWQNCKHCVIYVLLWVSKMEREGIAKVSLVASWSTLSQFLNTRSKQTRNTLQ